MCTQSVSHFETPLFRLAAQQPGLEVRVFYIAEIATDKRFDADYQQNIDWGSDLLAGYDSVHCANAREMNSRVDSWAADVVLMYGYAWPGAARMILSRWLRGKPQIHRGTLSPRRNPLAGRRGAVLRRAGRFLLGRFDAHHFGGNCSRRVLLDAGAIPDSLFFVPYSVDSQHFLALAGANESLAAAAGIRTAVGWNATDHVLLLICQHSWVKGPEIALEAFRQIRARDKSARLLIVGSGTMTGQMKDFVQQHGLGESTHFAGFVPSAQTVPYYLAADVVLCTSRYETWARMINEAMLCGKPCIVNEMVAAAHDLVRDGTNGYIVEDIDPRLYADTAARYFSLGHGAQHAVAEAARKAAMDFSYERNIGRVLDAARYAVARHRK